MNSTLIFEDYIKPHSEGNSLHFSILQPDLKYFSHESGLITYALKFGQTLVLGDPIFSSSLESDRIEFLNCFISEFPDSAFVQTSKYFAKFLHTNFGFFGTRIGTERLISLQTWSLTGKRKQTIRTACNQAFKRNIVIRENQYEDNFSEVSNDWLSTRTVKSREISFLVRKFPYYENETRKFCAYQNDKLIAFIVFDPIYVDAECIGYIPNISRASESFRQGAFYAIMVEAINRFKTEGKQFINLGLSPLHISGPSESFESKPFLRLLKFIRNYSPQLYNYSGIEHAKSRFFDPKRLRKDGEQNSMFLSHNSKLPLIKLLAIFRASNVI